MSQAKNISELSVIELKAAAYDHLANIEASNRSLEFINAEIKKRQTAEKGPEEVKEIPNA